MEMGLAPVSLAICWLLLGLVNRSGGLRTPGRR